MKKPLASHTPTDAAYTTLLAAAYVRGTQLPLPGNLAQLPLSALASSELEMIVAVGLAAGLRLHPFKRTMGLQRVRMVLGALHGMRPTNLLDIGCGRGVFIWPLLAELPYVSVTAIDLLPHRLEVVNAVRRGGVGRLSCAHMDATRLGFPSASFEVVTVLEVLEHIPNTMRALAEATRVAARFVILSVPSKPDNNPEHIHLFTEPQLRDLFTVLGVRSVQFNYVLNHVIVIASVAG